MKAAILQLWDRIMSSLIEFPDPGVRYLASIALFIIVCLFLIIIPAGMVFGFIKGMTELIINALQNGGSEVIL